jgi:Tfp pilus assembly protein PilO
MIIAVTLDDEANQLNGVIEQFKALLPQLPSQAERTMITATTPLLRGYAGDEFYARAA